MAATTFGLLGVQTVTTTAYTSTNASSNAGAHAGTKRQLLP